MEEAEIKKQKGGTATELQPSLVLSQASLWVVRNGHKQAAPTNPCAIFIHANTGVGGWGEPGGVGKNSSSGELVRKYYCWLVKRTVVIKEIHTSPWWNVLPELALYCFLVKLEFHCAHLWICLKSTVTLKHLNMGSIFQFGSYSCHSKGI